MPDERGISMSEFKMVDSHSKQIALLHEGQTGIKNSLKQKPTQDDFSKLEMRVAKLENKVA
jgi:hypothetical protein